MITWQKGTGLSPDGRDFGFAVNPRGIFSALPLFFLHSLWNSAYPGRIHSWMNNEAWNRVIWRVVVFVCHMNGSGGGTVFCAEFALILSGCCGRVAMLHQDQQDCARRSVKTNILLGLVSVA